jgi:hypothetical protein
VVSSLLCTCLRSIGSWIRSFRSVNNMYRHYSHSFARSIDIVIVVANILWLRRGSSRVPSTRQCTPSEAGSSSSKESLQNYVSVSFCIQQENGGFNLKISEVSLMLRV